MRYFLFIFISFLMTCSAFAKPAPAAKPENVNVTFEVSYQAMRQNASPLQAQQKMVTTFALKKHTWEVVGQIPVLNEKNTITVLGKIAKAKGQELSIKFILIDPISQPHYVFEHKIDLTKQEKATFDHKDALHNLTMTAVKA